MKQLWYMIPATAWTIIITIASLISAKKINNIVQVNFFSLDKIVHFLIYLILSVSLVWGIKKMKGEVVLNYVNLFYIFLFSSGLGLLLEILQKQITFTRHFDINDIIANIIGAFVGCILFLRKNKKK